MIRQIDPRPLADKIKAERDRRIEAVAWRFERNASEVRLGINPTESLAALDAYVQALREVPEQSGFPGTINWPEQPE